MSTVLISGVTAVLGGRVGGAEGQKRSRPRKLIQQTLSNPVLWSLVVQTVCALCMMLHAL